jgi:hypothetical protein
MSPSDKARLVVEAWLRRWPAEPGAPFPYREVTRAITMHGTGGFPEPLRGTLVEAWTQTRKHDDVSGTDPHWLVAAWLDCVTSTAREAATYNSYTMSALFMTWCRLGDIGTRSERLATALTAHLVWHELRRAASSAEPGARRLRTAAAVHVAQLLGPTTSSGGGRHADAASDEALAARRRCEELLASPGHPAPIPAEVLLDGSLPLVTTQPDEPLFLRSVQIMELLAFRAAAYADAAQLHAACFPPSIQSPTLNTRLRLITDILGQATRLFRLVAMIDRHQFAVIRNATSGTGALQSVSFARFERRCRGGLGLRPETDEAVARAVAPVPRSSLSGTLRHVLADLGGTAPDIAHALHRDLDNVNTAWRRWKRTHYGIARRIIGDVPGTGGTDGVRYLARHREEDLL